MDKHIVEANKKAQVLQNNKQEKIVCAAIRFAIPKEDYTGVKIVIGVDYESIVNDGVLDYLAHGEMTNIWQKGFITNEKRFVDPKEAWEIAEDAEQINYDTIDYSCYEENGYQELKPEDLY